MGYDLHITRAEDWKENEGFEISADEWLTVVNDDPELAIDSKNGEYYAVWSGACSYPEGGWFDWWQGNVLTTSPDRAILGKMLEISQRLEAHVQGDDGEIYTSVEEWTGP